jgi:hypothetical protein
MKNKLIRSLFVACGITIVAVIAGCSDGGSSSSTPSSSTESQGESAESFVKRAVESGAGVAGSASVVCDENGGDFAGKFTWRDADQYQTFHGKVSGTAGNWHMDEFQMTDPISN